MNKLIPNKLSLCFFYTMGLGIFVGVQNFVVVGVQNFEPLQQILNPYTKFPFFNSSTAWFTARAVNAI
jgi:hypothetical protein